MADHGVTRGCNADGTLFCPEGPVKRAHMAAFITRALDLSETSGVRFADVPSDSVFATAIDRLATAGITTGCEGGRFCPDETVTRAQMAAFFVRALGLSEGGGDGYRDVAPGSVFATDIDRLTTAGITSGCQDDRFCPEAAVTRQQMVTFLARALDDSREPESPDEPSPTTDPESGDGTQDEPSPAPDPGSGDGTRDEPSPAPDPEGGDVTHGAQLNVGNTGLRGAGYVYDSATDTYTHPTRGALRQSGGITTTHDGQVIENVDVAGGITVAHDNVTVRNCRVRYSGTVYAIDALNHGPTGTVIEHCDITHVGDSPHEAFGIYIGEGTARWNNIWRFQVGVYVNSSNTRVEYNLVWDPQRVAGTHGTGVSANSGGSNLVFYRNSIRGNSSAALALYAHGPFHGVTVRQNLFEGGNDASFCLNAGNNKNGVGVNTDIRITGNLFGRADHPDCGTYGPFFNWDGSRPGAAWCNNRWADTREIVGTEANCG